MKYVIMLAIIIVLAMSDWLTGFIKAYVLGCVSSNKMRLGGIKKLAEIVLMFVGIALNIGIDMLSNYYPEAVELTDKLGPVCAFAVFVYLVTMELVSILENFVDIFPQASWALAIVKKLSNTESSKDEKEE